MDLKNIKSPQDIKHCSVEELYHLASQTVKWLSMAVTWLLAWVWWN